MTVAVEINGPSVNMIDGKARQFQAKIFIAARSMGKKGHEDRTSFRGPNPKARELGIIFVAVAMSRYRTQA